MMALSVNLIHSAEIDTFLGSDSFPVIGTLLDANSLPAHDTV